MGHYEQHKFVPNNLSLLCDCLNSLQIDLSGLIPKALRKMLDLKLTQNVLGLTPVAQW